MMPIRYKFTKLRARARETTKHWLSNAHYFNPTRSMKENKKRKDAAVKAASAERVSTLERALNKAYKTRKVSKRAASSTTNIHTGPSYSLRLSLSGLG